MAIIFIIVGVSVSGLFCLYVLKALELRGAAKFFPLLRARADRAAMRLVGRLRRIDFDHLVGVFRARAMTSLARLAVFAGRLARNIVARFRFQLKTFIRSVSGVGIKAPLTKGSVSLFLQRISPEKKLPARIASQSVAGRPIPEVVEASTTPESDIA